MSWEIGLTTIFFIVVMASVVLVGRFILQRSEEGGDNAPDIPEGLSVEDAPLPSTQALLARAFHFMGESVPAGKRDNEPLRGRLLKAGYRWPTAVTIFQGIRIASALAIAGVVGWTILLWKGEEAATLVPVLCAGGFGYLFPERVLKTCIRARGKRIRSGVPAAVDLLVLAMEAGQSLDQAMHEVAKALSGTYPDLSEEFIFYGLEMRAGKSRYDALRRLSERSPDAELQKLAGVLLDSDRYGTSLGPALRTHARYLRVRMRHGAQEAARKLSVKLTLPVFFFIFPSVLLVTLAPAVLQMRESLNRMMDGL